MMTPKMKEDFCTQILGASRQLFLSGRISEICQEKGTQKQLEFLLELLQAELTFRDENRRKRLIKRAGFPTYKTFEGYSYHCVKFPPAFSREELETLEFVPGKKNLVLYGPVGIGKTHMAIAAGVKACNLGYKTKFYTVTELVLKLAESRKNGTLERLLRDLRSLDLLILDEWGYVPVDKDGSQLLFRVISDSYESKSLILTTNLEFSKWGGIFTDDQMAAAMIDRLVHHGHLLIFEGKSYRMEHALMRRMLYDAKYAQQQYEQMLSESRKGISLTEQELNRINDTIIPLLKKGQSLPVICERYRDELPVSDRTIYSYIDAGLLDARNIDLRRKLRRPERKKERPGSQGRPKMPYRTQL